MNNTNVLIEHYCNTRINDINQFVNINELKSKQSSNSKQFYEKRYELKRTTSHKKRIIPRILKLKRKVESQVDGNSSNNSNSNANKRCKRIPFIERCRKHRRRFHLLIKQHHTNNTSNACNTPTSINPYPNHNHSPIKWLPTHRYNCTRFQMRNMWNIQVPMCSNERSRRMEMETEMGSKSKQSSCSGNGNNRCKSKCLDSQLFTREMRISNRKIVCETKTKSKGNTCTSSNTNTTTNTKSSQHQHRSVIFDQSYMQTIEIEATQQLYLLELLNHFTVS